MRLPGIPPCKPAGRRLDIWQKPVEDTEDAKTTSPPVTHAPQNKHTFANRAIKVNSMNSEVPPRRRVPVSTTTRPVVRTAVAEREELKPQESPFPETE